MPKGTHGCFRCGSKSDSVIQIWLKQFVDDERDTNYNRKQKSIDALQRSLCARHASQAWNAAWAALPTPHGNGRLGCRGCGKRPTRYIVRLWERTNQQAGSKTMRVKSVSLCEDCGEGAYIDALNAAQFDSESYGVDENKKPYDMSGTRSRQKVTK